MLKILSLIFLGHTHHWKIINSSSVRDEFGGRGTRIYLQCTKCGDVKKKDFI